MQVLGFPILFSDDSLEKECSFLFHNLSEIEPPLENMENHGNSCSTYHEDSVTNRQNPYIVTSLEGIYSNDDEIDHCSNEADSLVGPYYCPLVNTSTSAKSSYHSIYSEIQGW